MNEKQLWVHLLAYNVIRLLMAQAASNAGLDPRDLSFKHTVRLWTEWAARGLSTTQTLPVVEDPARPGSAKDRAPWSRVGDKVSAIRLQDGCA